MDIGDSDCDRQSPARAHICHGETELLELSVMDYGQVSRRDYWKARDKATSSGGQGVANRVVERERVGGCVLGGCREL